MTKKVIAKQCPKCGLYTPFGYSGDKCFHCQKTINMKMLENVGTYSIIAEDTTHKDRPRTLFQVKDHKDVPAHLDMLRDHDWEIVWQGFINNIKTLDGKKVGD